MILTAENGWSFGEFGYGEDKKAELQKALNDYLIEQGEEPVDWSENEAQPVRGTDEHRSRREEPSRSPTPQDKPGPRLRRV
jgi:hypothetical protein